MDRLYWPVTMLRSGVLILAWPVLMGISQSSLPAAEARSEVIGSAQPFADWRSNPEPAEEFLRTARIVDTEELPVGISRPLRVTLEAEDGTRARASFKSIDIYEQKMLFEDGRMELNFRDSWESEIAAYELDRLLGLGLVPPTVEREVDGETGALRLWIEDAMSEAERKESGAHAPDPVAWSAQVANVRLFFNLTHNTDFNNINNLLIDGDFRICAIDHSRAFKTQKQLVSEEMMMRFSRSLIERLRGLDREELEAVLGDRLTKAQIKGLLARRDRILDRVDELVELKGEELVLFD